MQRESEPTPPTHSAKNGWSADLSRSAAVVSNGKNYVFFPDDQSSMGIGYLKEPDSNKSNYEICHINVGDSPTDAHKEWKRMAAIAYKHNGKNEIRVYKLTPKGRFRELRHTVGEKWQNGNDKWRTGELDEYYGQNPPDVDQRSPLSATATPDEKGDGGKIIVIFRGTSGLFRGISCTYGDPSWTASFPLEPNA